MRARRATRYIALRAGAMLAASLVVSSVGRAQNTLTTTVNLPMLSPDATAYQNGATNGGVINFSVNATSGNVNLHRIMTVKIRCGTAGNPCPATIQWRRTFPLPVTAWTTITGVFTNVVMRCVKRDLVVDPGTCVDAPWHADPLVGTVEIRYTLGWTTDPPASISDIVHLDVFVYRQN